MKKLILIIILLTFVACSPNNKEEINLVAREDGSGTRASFVELFNLLEKGSSGEVTDKTYLEAVIANKTDVMMVNVTTDVQAIGYASLGSLNNTVKALAVDGVYPSKENIKNKTYAIYRPFSIIVQDDLSEIGQDFVSFIASNEGQEIIDKEYVAFRELGVEAEKYILKNTSGKLILAGSSSVAPVIEKLKEAYEFLNPNAVLEMQISDSTSGILAVLENNAQIGLSSRSLKEAEKEKVKEIIIALDGIVIIVNNNNAINNLTKEEVNLIFSGQIKQWPLLFENKIRNEKI